MWIIIKYLDTNKLSVDKWEVKKIKNRAMHFILVDGVLYKRGYFIPLLRCILLKQA